MNIADKLFAGR